jgi:hypothetical protein
MVEMKHIWKREARDRTGDLRRVRPHRRYVRVHRDGRNGLLDLLRAEGRGNDSRSDRDHLPKHFQTTEVERA